MKVLERSEIATEYTWSVEAIFPSDAEWEATYAKMREQVQADPYGSMRGHLGDGPEVVLSFFTVSEGYDREIGKLAIYAHTKNDQDTRVSTYQSMMSRISSLQAMQSEKESFFEPELLALDEATLTAYVGADILAPYRKLLDNIVRNKPHVLSDESEALLASFQDVLGSNGQVFGQLTNADFVHGSFTVDDVEYTVTDGRLGILLRDRDRRVRQLAYETVYNTYLNHKNAIAALYSGSVKKDVVLARARKFKTARERSLFANNIPESVYDALVKGVRDNLHHHHRYVALRKRVLGLDAVSMYDKYVPLVEADLDHYEYPEGFALVKTGLQALGTEYQSILQQAMDSRWIDVYETPGKRSGAYSTGFYATKPYILLNYQGDYNSVSTLAHELGHSLHTYLSSHHQPPQYSGYSLFLAEIASTVNETLLVNHLLDVTDDKIKRATLLNQQIDSLTATIYRQTMFAEFEWRAHEMVENGEALTHDSLSNLYATLNDAYHGPAFSADDRAKAEWSRIPHFYRAYYVFQYATGMSAALVFADRIRRDGSEAVDKYLGFLKSGSRDYPLEVLRDAGLDVADPSVITQALAIYGKLVDELAELLA